MHNSKDAENFCLRTECQKFPHGMVFNIPKRAEREEKWHYDRYHCPPQKILHQKAWDKCKVTLTSTYNLYKSLELPSNLKLRDWIPNDATTVWVYSRTQYRIHKHTPRVWKPFRPLLRSQWRSRHRLFIRKEDEPNSQHLDDITSTKIEELNTTTIKFT